MSNCIRYQFNEQQERKALNQRGQCVRHVLRLPSKRTKFERYHQLQTKTSGCVVKTPEDDVKGMNRNWILQSYAISPFRSPPLYNLYDEPEAFENRQKRDE